MPGLTLRGFLDLMAMQVLHAREKGWAYVYRARRHYGVFMDWNECPRNMLPVVAPRELIQRVRMINQARKASAGEVDEY
jgi:hypothetical protein